MKLVNSKELRAEMINAAVFNRHVDRSGDCWVWTAQRTRGYGKLWMRGFQARTMAHRAAYALAHGLVPAGLVVRHKCDNRACVRPEHLELGTQMDNIHDAMRRGRASPPPHPRGPRRRVVAL